MLINSDTDKRSFEWYKSLSLNERINIKAGFVLFCNVEWNDLSFIFSFKERTEILYNKIKKEFYLEERRK